MKKYKVKLEIEAEVEAFDEGDALDYANDIFGVDDEIKNVKVKNADLVKKQLDFHYLRKIE